jgi:hypothetical protein
MSFWPQSEIANLFIWPLAMPGGRLSERDAPCTRS